MLTTRVCARATWAKVRPWNRMRERRSRFLTVARMCNGTLYICHSAVMDGEARTSTAIYFHANNARVNRRGPGREHARSRPYPYVTPHSGVDNGGAATVVVDREWNISGPPKRNESWREHPWFEGAQGRDRAGEGRSDSFSKCDLCSPALSVAYCNNDIMKSKTRVINVSWETITRGIFFGNLQLFTLIL